MKFPQAFHILLALALASCTKEKHFALSNEMKNLATIKSGSFIVLQDALHTADMDTFRVVDYKDDQLIFREGHTLYKYDEIAVRLEGSGQRSYFTDFKISVRGGTNVLFMDTYHPYINGMVATSPPNNGYTSQGITQVNYHPSIQINNKVFANVFEMKGTVNGTYWHSFYNAPSALIQLELKTDTSHHLWQQLAAQINK